MKIKSLLFVSCFSLLATAFAENRHFHAEAKTNEIATAKQSTLIPGPCEIEIINDSIYDLNVYGRFDDGSHLVPFLMKSWSQPQYVNLIYQGACHLGMDFYIETVDGVHKYNGFTPVGKTIRIKSF